MLSVSTAAFDGYPMEQALQEIAQLGFDRVEPAYIRGYVEFDETAFAPPAIRVLRGRLDAAGLRAQAVSAHIDLGGAGAAEALARRIDLAAGIGCAILITNAGQATARARILTTLGANLRAAEDAGVTIALENPGHGEGAAFASAASGVDLLREIDAPQVRLNYDVGNVWTYNHGRVDPATDMNAALPFAVHGHLKDIRADGDDWQFVAIGDGDFGFAAIRDRLADAPPLPLALELPLRLRRPGRGDPQRGRDPVPLDLIRRTIARSRAFWHPGGSRPATPGTT